MFLSYSNLDDLSKKTDGAVATQNDLEFESFEFKPNPTDGVIDLNMELNKNSETNIVLYDAQGSKIFSETISSMEGPYQHSFDLNDKPAGIYLLNVTQGGRSATKKIVRE